MPTRDQVYENRFKSKAGRVMKIYAAFLLVTVYLYTPTVIRAEPLPNTITFEDRSGEPGLVKLVGPTSLAVEVPVGESRTVNATAGDYHILVRYGNNPKVYRYAKGDPFSLTQTATEYSDTTITLHKVIGGNYPTHPATKAEFDGAVVAREAFEEGDEKTSQPETYSGLADGQMKAAKEIKVILLTVKQSYDRNPVVLSFDFVKQGLEKLDYRVLTKSKANYDAELKIELKGKAIGTDYSPGGHLYTGAQVDYILLLIEKESHTTLFSKSFVSYVYPPSFLLREWGKKVPVPYAEAAYDMILFENMAEMISQLSGRDKSIDFLVISLKNKKPDVRKGAVIALGKTKNARAIEPLINALKDRDSDVRWKAVYILGTIKDPRAVEPLIKALKDDNSLVRKYVVDAIGEIKDARVVEPLIRALKDVDSDVRKSVAYALGEIKDPRAVEPLIKALKDENWLVRDWAVSALGKIKDPRAVKPLMKALKDKNPDVREGAAHALKAITGEDF